jgi:hypothetical protein
MFSGDFQANLRKLNPNLRIYCGNDDKKPAGIFHISDPETSICGIDKSFIPEWPIMDEVSGRMLKGGWRRALKVLIGAKLIDRVRTERVFGTQIMGTRKPETMQAQQDRIQREIEDSYKRGLMRNGKAAMSRDEILDIAREVTKNESK